MNQQQQSQLPFPMPFWFTQQSSVPSPSVDIPPARVRVALQVLADFTEKTRQRAVANDVTVHELDGQTLSSEERQVQEAACAVLTLYFAGRLAPDLFDQVHYAKQGISLPSALPAPPRGQSMCCPRCMGEGSSGVGDPNCTWCRGSGAVRVYPSES